MEDPSLLSNLKESYALTEVILRAPWWALDDVWPKRHVYFVRHLRLCDLAKKRLLQRRILRIGHYFVQKAWVDYRLPMVWHEKLRIKILMTGLLKKGRVPLLKYELYSFRKGLLLAEVYLLYHPSLSRRHELETLFFDPALKEKLLKDQG